MPFSTETLFPIASTIVYILCLIHETILGTNAWLISPSDHEHRAVAAKQPSAVQLSIAYGIIEPIVTALLLQVPFAPAMMLMLLPQLCYIGTPVVMAKLVARITDALRWPDENISSSVTASTEDTATHEDELAEDHQKKMDCDELAEKQQASPMAFKVPTGLTTTDTITVEAGTAQPDLELSREEIARYYIPAVFTVAVTNASLLLTYHSLSATSFWGDDESLPWFLLSGVFQFIASICGDGQVADCTCRAMVLGQKLSGEMRNWRHFQVQLGALAVLLVTRMVVRQAVGLDAWLAAPQGSMETWFGNERYSWLNTAFESVTNIFSSGA
ncbi:hypothetical protein KC354_g3476 [Hortaea werneckii]|nr:hypothetical protein KC354_g3476 [Hortaea werneckii]